MRHPGRRTRASPVSGDPHMASIDAPCSGGDGGTRTRVSGSCRTRQQRRRTLLALGRIPHRGLLILSCPADREPQPSSEVRHQTTTRHSTKCKPTAFRSIGHAGGRLPRVGRGGAIATGGHQTRTAGGAPSAACGDVPAARVIVLAEDKHLGLKPRFVPLWLSLYNADLSSRPLGGAGPRSLS